MFKKIFSGILLLTLCCLIPSGADKSQKAYELIYKDVQLLKQQLLKLDEKIDQNRESISEMQSTLTELLNLARHSRNEQAGILAEQKKIPLQYQALVQKYDSLNRELSQVAEKLLEIQRLVTPPPEIQEEGEIQDKPPETGEDQTSGTQTTGEEEAADTENPPPIEIPPDISANDVFTAARSDYVKGNFDLAVDGFTMYREYFPESPLADNALYWIGESLFSKQQYEEAITQFIELILNYSGSDMVAAAYYKRGLCLIELGKIEEAVDVLKLLITKYPYEEEAKNAQQKIKELGY